MATKLPTYLPTLVLAAIATALGAQQGHGFGVLLVALVFMAALLRHGVGMLRRPAERKARAVRLGLWALALVLVVAAQAWWEHATRAQAQRVVQAVNTYRAQAGRYPDSLQPLGLDEAALREQWGLRYQLREGGKPVLGYPSGFMPLTMLAYDFGSGRWVTNAY